MKFVIKAGTRVGLVNAYDEHGRFIDSYWGKDDDEAILSARHALSKLRRGGEILGEIEA